jgi:hypothetical protein
MHKHNKEQNSWKRPLQKFKTIHARK